MNETYFTAKQITQMLNIAQSTLVLWWTKGLPRTKIYNATHGRMIYHTSKSSLESFLNRQLSPDELARADKE